MQDLIYCPPKFVRKMFPAFQWESKIDKILLTFDDGPTYEVLGQILDFLDKHKLQAAFFLVGSNVQKHGDLVGEIINSGHLIANHTQNHQDIILCKKQKIHSEIDNCNNELLSVSGSDPRYFRPPHGRFDWRTSRILKEKHLKCVMWSLLTGDFTKNRSLACGLVRKYLTANSIVTLHDNIKSKGILISVLETILETADRNGFIFGTPNECLL